MDLELVNMEGEQIEFSRVSIRGTLTDTHDEITRTQVKALNSTL